jgi:hypothetical protein
MDIYEYLCPQVTIGTAAGSEGGERIVTAYRLTGSQGKVKVTVMLRLTVSQYVSCDQILFSV